MRQQERYIRFTLLRRIEHWTMVASFVTLAVTGLIQRFMDVPLSEMLIALLGGVETVRVIHRVGATVMMLETIYHFGSLLYGWFVKRVPLSMLPGKEDFIAAWKLLRHNLGFEEKSPKQGFFTFEEKFEYWGLVWGTLLMGVTGFFLWNPITAAKYLPGAWIPVAKAAHGNEALLAVLVIAFWHTYHVLIKHFNTSMYTGYITQVEIEQYHAKVLEEEPYIPPPPSDLRFKRRKTTFSIVYGVISVVLLAVVYWFVTVEETAVAMPADIEEIAKIVSYSPLEPSPYPSPTAPDSIAQIGTSWEDGFGVLFNERCGTCHSAGGGRGNLDLTTYQGLLQGGNSGPAIKPNAPGVSLVVIWSLRESHPGRFSAAELAAIRAWIEAGAPER
jgi:cytochrome b subunit of formate dehydrogenase